MNLIFKYDTTEKIKKFGLVEKDEFKDFDAEVLSTAKAEYGLAHCVIDINVNVNATGLTTYDGVPLASNVKVLLVAQTDLKQNGLYYVSEANNNQLLRVQNHFSNSFMLFSVGLGNKYKNTIWQLGAGKVIGTDNLVITKLNTPFTNFLIKPTNQIISTTLVDVTGLSQLVKPNELYSFQSQIYVSGNLPLNQGLISMSDGIGTYIINPQSNLGSNPILWQDFASLTFDYSNKYHYDNLQWTISMNGYYRNSGITDVTLSVKGQSDSINGITVLGNSFIKYTKEN